MTSELPTNRLEMALLKLVTMWPAVDEVLVKDNLYPEEFPVGGAQPGPSPPTLKSEELKVRAVARVPSMQWADTLCVTVAYTHHSLWH